MQAKAAIRLKVFSDRQLKAMVTSLSPEVSKPRFDRARVTVESDKSFLVIKVEADDTVSLRSTLNAYLRWVNSMINVIQLLER
jgi:tRNA threonylcarbamoyladenosine modification (KEOPS) complex  Pcc1 subunit